MDTDFDGFRAFREPHEMKMSALRDHAVLPPTLVVTGRTQVFPDRGADLQRFAEGCVRAIRSNSGLAASGDPAAIHTARIALTKLRAVALFFQPLLADAEWPRIDKELAWLNSALGRARNRDVTVEYVQQKRYRRWAGQSRKTLLRSQDRAHRRLAKELRSTRYIRLISELDRWLERNPWRGNGRATRLDRLNDHCEERLRRWRDEIARKGRHVRALRGKLLHRLRIQSKHYRYMVDGLLDLGIPVSREDFAFCETAKLAHQALGDIRDLRRFRKSMGRRPPHYRKRKHELIRRLEKSFRD